MKIQTLKLKALQVGIFYLIATLLFSTIVIQPVSAADSLNQQTEESIKTSTYLSPVKQAPMPFTGLALSWKQTLPENTSVKLYLKFLTDDGWTEWTKIDGEYEGLNKGGEQNPEDFVSTNLATAYQYKVVLTSKTAHISPVVENIRFTYIHAKSATPDGTMKASLQLPQVALLSDTASSTRMAASAEDGLRVTSRAEWGADESIRIYGEDKPEGDVIETDEGYEKQFASELKITRTVASSNIGKTLTWPLEYPEKISKIIVHHTATTSNLDDPKQAIRNIYYYHSITRGWGDIGYNYIIDKNGNIYEGRYGGDGVVGGHAAKYNVGSIGIAVLGNYQENRVPESVTASLTNLVKVKSAKHDIDPEGSSMFRGEMLKNVIGHKDVGATACPGKNLYALLPAIRKMAKGKLISGIVDKRRLVTDNMNYDYQMATELNAVQIDSGMDKTLTIKLKNTGTKSWGANSYLMLSNNGALQYLRNAEPVKTTTAGKSVSPGSTATFRLKLKARSDGGYSTMEIFPMVNGTKKIEKYLNVPLQVISASMDYEFVDLKYDRQFIGRNQTTTATLILKNTGTITWKRGGENRLRIGTENPRDHVSRYIPTPGTRLAKMTQAKVKPGETAEFKIKLRAPAREGVYREYFTPVIEGVSWLENKGTYLEFVVSDSSYKAKYLGAQNMEAFAPGEKKLVWMEFMNMGRRAWQKDGNLKFKLDIVKSANLNVDEIEMQADKVLPGENVKVQMAIHAPAKEGLYRALVTPMAGNKKLTIRPIVLFIKVSEDVVVQTDWISRKAVTSSTTAAKSTSDLIRIGLGFTGDPVISASGLHKLYEGAREITTLTADTKAAVTYSQGKYKVKVGTKTYTTLTPPIFKPVYGSILRIDNYENHPSWKPELNDNEYRGNLEVHYYENRLQVVNELPLNDYLKGVAEISSSENYEKIKAIIVLARSYAKFYMTKAEKFPGAPYHLKDDDLTSQVYLGHGFAKRNITGSRAVENTKGEVVTYKGEAIKTPYFSSSDGRTRSAQEVWGWTDTPYLVSVDDPGCRGQEMRGHGVGLSGCGAQYFANQGKNYKEIIKYYFQGVEVEKK